MRRSHSGAKQLSRIPQQRSISGRFQPWISLLADRQGRLGRSCAVIGARLLTPPGQSRYADVAKTGRPPCGCEAGR